MKSIHWNPGGLFKPQFEPTRFPAARLFSWMVRPRIPILESNNALVTTFIKGMLNGDSVDFVYVGGSKPGSPRTIDVSLVFQHSDHGRIYIAGYCHSRAANRVFALDLVMVF